PPRLISARTTTRNSGSSAARMRGAVATSSRVDPGAMKSGHRKEAAPTALTRRIDTVARAETGTRRAGAGAPRREARRPAMVLTSAIQGLPHLVDGEPRCRSEDLAHLRREGR